MRIVETAQLFNQQGGRDAEYHVSLLEVDGGYEVHYANGRRGSTLQRGKKTATPVEEAAARLVYDTVMKTQLKKGYRPGTSDSGHYDEPGKLGEVMWHMLLGPVADPKPFLEGAGYVLEPKYDGMRMLLIKEGSIAMAQNRSGEGCSPDSKILTALKALPVEQLVLDGESCGAYFVAFDVLKASGEDLRGWPLHRRRTLLETVLGGNVNRAIRLGQQAAHPDDKGVLFDRLRAEEREGVVFKKFDGPYVAGRTHKLAFKYKFVERINVEVISRNVQRSVLVGVRDGRQLVSICDLTVPVNKAVPAVGQLLEIEYLYAHRSSNQVSQAVFKRVRDDIKQADSVADLKYKNTTEDT